MHESGKMPFNFIIIDIYQPNVEGYDKKTDSLYLKGIIADKMLVYDD